MWLVFRLVVLASLPPPLHVNGSRLILNNLNKRQHVDAGTRLFDEPFPERRVVVQHVGAHSLLRGGVGGKHRVTQGAINNTLIC